MCHRTYREAAGWLPEGARLARELRGEEEPPLGIEHAEHRARAIDIGERLEVLKDYPTPPICTSPFAPIWITEMVRQQHGK
jgi:hypothetical protein